MRVVYGYPYTFIIRVHLWASRIYRSILISLDPWWPLSTTVVHTYKLQILDVHRKTLSHRLSLNDPSNTTIVNFKVPSPTLEHLYMHKTPLAKHSNSHYVTTPAPSLPPPNPHPSHPPMPHLNFSSTDQFWQPSPHAATSTY